MGFGFHAMIALMIVTGSKVPALTLEGVYAGVFFLYKNTVGFMLCMTSDSNCSFTGLTVTPWGNPFNPVNPSNPNPSNPTNPTNPEWTDVTPPDLPPNPCANNPACAIPKMQELFRISIRRQMRLKSSL
jgi:hypothetical protein